MGYRQASRPVAQVVLRMCELNIDRLPLSLPETISEMRYKWTTYYIILSIFHSRRHVIQHFPSKTWLNYVRFLEQGL